MTRFHLIERIRALSDEDLARVAPYLEADLDVLADLEAVRAELRRAREAACAESRLDADEALDALLQGLAGDD